MIGGETVQHRSTYYVSMTMAPRMNTAKHRKFEGQQKMADNLVGNFVECTINDSSLKVTRDVLKVLKLHQYRDLLKTSLVQITTVTCLLKENPSLLSKPTVADKN